MICYLSDIKIKFKKSTKTETLKISGTQSLAQGFLGELLITPATLKN